MSKIRQATILKAAAVIVAAPRYMGAFGAAVGANIHQDFPYLVTVEVYSGLAMAILEGAAVSYAFTRWRQMKKGSLDWWVLTVLVISLLLLLPLIAGPYLVAMQSNLPVNQVVSPFFLWVWSILISGLPVLIIASIGYADIEPLPEVLPVLSVPKTNPKPIQSPTNNNRKNAPEMPKTQVLREKADHAKREKTVKRQQEVKKLWNNGVTKFVDIATKVNASPKTISKDVKELGLKLPVLNGNHNNGNGTVK